MTIESPVLNNHLGSSDFLKEIKNPEQAKIAEKWINNYAAVIKMAFPENPAMAAYLEGVKLAITNALNTEMEVLGETKVATNMLQSSVTGETSGVLGILQNNYSPENLQRGFEAIKSSHPTPTQSTLMV